VKFFQTKFITFIFFVVVQGIIRDIVQNHLLQVLTILAMEAPTKCDGPVSGESIRNAKVQVLNSIPPVTIEECFLGQYEGYTDDPTIQNKDSNTPTFVAIRVWVHTRKYCKVLLFQIPLNFPF